MGKFEVNTPSEINIKSSEKEKKKSFWSKFVDIFLILLLGVSLIVSGTVIYFKVRYVSCFVSGMSMFPTLNFNAINSNGDVILPSNSSETSEVGSKVDFLLADSKDGYLEDINRFDVVCSYFAADYDVYGNVKSNSYQKIKRVVGLPGETVWLVTSEEEGTRYSGKLYVSNKEDISSQQATEILQSLKTNPSPVLETYSIKEIDQPLKDEDYDKAYQDIYNDKSKRYNNGNSFNYNFVWQLQKASSDSKGEYILLGDNRNNSYDSTEVGKIAGTNIQARVRAKIGQGTIQDNGDSASLNIFSFKWRSLNA